MTDAAFLDAVREAVRAEVEPLRRLVERLQRQRDTLTPAQRRLGALLPKLFAAAEIFTTASLPDLARLPVGHRVELAALLRRDFNNDARRIGIGLRAVADAGTDFDGMRLVALPGEAGIRRWELVPVQSL
ncbi:MAG: hypothetical protein KA387_06340 [Rubrivivax sp.]|nr:hypothetical protein [Rubrivivax sp.]